MREHAAELRKEERRNARELKAAEKAAEAERDVLEKIAEMPDEDRVLAERLHRIVKDVAPSLEPRTWYGMPAYAKDGKVLCFFQAADKFKARYATLGFNDVASLDDGEMWPTAFALVGLTPETEARITDLVTRAAG
ncbi:iron chaperone [Actinomadura harenae]|nr:DUF1801 domain-containing protein [Actinomadura harenae]